MSKSPPIESLYQDIRQSIQNIDDILEVIQIVENNLDNADRDKVIQNLDPQLLEARLGEYSKDPDVQRAFILNIEKMRSVKRKDGHPYALHPIRVASIVAKVLEGDTDAKESIIYALLHDYIEEGDGKNREAIDVLNRDFPHIENMGEKSLLLSEPEFPFKEISQDYDWNMIELVAFVQQLKMIDNKAMMNAAFADKIDNMHDNAYIFEKYKTSEKIEWKLSKKEGFYRYYLENMGGKADERLWKILELSIDAVSKDLKIPQKRSQKKLETYRHIQKHFADPIQEQIKAYHRKLDINVQTIE